MPRETHPQIAPGQNCCVSEAEISVSALDAMLDAVMIFDADGVIVVANRVCGQLLGHDPADMVGQRIRTFLPAELRAGHIERQRLYSRDPVSQRMGERPILLMQRKDGTILPVEFSLAPFTTPSGTYATAVIREVTASAGRMAGQRHLALSERAARLGGWEEDGGTGLVRWSQGMHDLLGLPHGTVTPGPEALLARIHPDDRSSVIKQCDHARVGGGDWFVEVRLAPHPSDPEGSPSADGQEPVRTVSILGHVELDDAGVMLGSTGTVQDVSAQVLLERQLHISHGRLRAAFDNAPIGMALIDVRPGRPVRYLVVNPALAELAGRPVTELLERPLLADIHPDDRQRQAELLQQLISGESDRIRSEVTRLLCPDAQERWISINAALVRDHEGNPTYIVADIVDITAGRNAQTEDQRRAARDTRIAAILQDDLHPYVPHRIGPVRVASRYQQAGAGELVGGDWTDVFALPGGRIGIVVGDVAGHGIEAAVAMARLRTLVWMLATSGASPAGVMRRLNDVMHETDVRDNNDLATIVHAQLDPSTGRLDYCSAGHLPMLVLPTRQAHDRRVTTPIPAIGGPPIGVV